MNNKELISAKLNLPVKEISVNGTNLSYIEQGAGEPVVFIHGAVSDCRVWLEQFTAFAEDYRVISYSRRFHQPNNREENDSNYTRATHTADLVGFLQALNIEKANLIGHSYGASIALSAALDHPELVGSLILGEPSPFPDLFQKEELSFLSEQKAGFEAAMKLAQNGNEEAAVRHFLKVIVGIDALPLLPEERRSAVLANADTLLPMLRTYYDSAIDREQLNNLNIPTLLVTGELSPRIARLSNETINRNLPNSKIAILKCASHGLQIENSEGFNQLVSDFLSVNIKTIKFEKTEQLYETVC